MGQEERLLSEVLLCGIEMRQKLTSQLEELLKNQRRGFGIILLEHSRMCVMHILPTISIKFDWNGIEWKDTYVVMNTTSESICPNNAMQLDTLIRRK